MKRQIIALRWRHRLGPVQIGGRLGLAPSTVHAVLLRCRLIRLGHIDGVTEEPVRRYEHTHPGSLIHVDVTEFATILTVVGIASSPASRAGSTPAPPPTAQENAANGPAPAPRSCTPSSTTAPAPPTPRSAPTRGHTAAGVLRRAVAWFTDHGVTVERVLSDNGSGYHAHTWQQTCTDLAITPERTRP